MRTHRARRRLGLGVLFAGLAFGGAMLVLAIGGMASRVDNLAELPVSGGVVPSSIAGDVTIFASIDGLASSRADRPAGTITLINRGERTIPVQVYGGSSAFNVGGRSGVAMWTATIPSDSRIVLRSDGVASNVDGWLIGESPTSVRGFVLPLVAGVLLMTLGLVVGLLIIVPTLSGGRAHSIRWPTS